MELSKSLAEFDAEIEKQLIEPYLEIEKKSRALANSLRRCFEEARESRRFEAAYKLGLLEKELNDAEVVERVNNEFEEKDFMIFREFVRLLRACSLHIGGHISEQIKDCYNRTFKTARILIAYRVGIENA